MKQVAYVLPFLIVLAVINLPCPLLGMSLHFYIEAHAQYHRLDTLPPQSLGFPALHT